MLAPMVRQLWVNKHSLLASQEGWRLAEATCKYMDGQFRSNYLIMPVGMRPVPGDHRSISERKRELFFHITAKALEGSELHLRALAIVGATAIYNQHEQEDRQAT